MPGRIPWTWGGIGSIDSIDQVIRSLDDRMGYLESYLREIHKENSFGPIPGAYFPVALGRSESPLPTGAIDLFPLGPVEARPIALGVICFGGDCTIDVESEGASILSAGSVSLSDGVSQYLNDRGDFSVEKIKVDATLYNDSNDSGTPAHARAVLWCKGVSKVEPA